MARLSNTGGETSDLQTAVNTLNANKQNSITNAPVEDGQAVLDGASLNKIGIKDDTLAVETSTKVTKLGVNKEKTQVKLTPIGDATKSKAVLTETSAVRSIGVDRTFSIAWANKVTNLAVDAIEILEELTPIGGATKSRAVFLRRRPL